MATEAVEAVDLSTLDRLALEKSGSDDPTWRPFYFEVVNGGLMVEGCATTVYKRGPRKGQTKYLLNEDRRKVILTTDELKQL